MILNTSIGSSSNKESEISVLWVWTKGIIDDDDDDETSLSSEWEFSHLKLQQGDDFHDSLSLSTLGCERIFERRRQGVVDDRSISIMSSANLSSGTVTFNESFVEATMEMPPWRQYKERIKVFITEQQQDGPIVFSYEKLLLLRHQQMSLYVDGRLCLHNDQHDQHHQQNQHHLLLLHLLHHFIRQQ